MTWDSAEAERFWTRLGDLHAKLDDIGRRQDERDIRDDRRDERLGSHEQRVIVLERVVEGLARREDIAQLGELLESRMTAADLTGQVQVAQDIGSIRDRVGKLEGAQSRADGRQTARGAIGGVAATIILVLVVVVAKLLGVDVPMP